jgi:hypothetical protein
VTDTARHYTALATEHAMSRLLGRMTAPEAERLYETARATGKSISEVVGHVAARAHLWQFVDLVWTTTTTTPPREDPAPMTFAPPDCDPAELEPCIDDHDPVTFACENGDIETTAHELSYGDVYRKSQLWLDETSAHELRHHLRTRGLELVNDDPYWVIGRLGDGDDDTQPTAPAPTRPLNEDPAAPAPCPECGKPAAPGRDTCGDDACVEDFGRKALAPRRPQPKKDAP